MRAERFEERTAANVATASTSVPAPVSSEEIVDQSVAENSIIASLPPESPPLGARLSTLAPVPGAGLLGLLASERGR